MTGLGKNEKKSWFEEKKSFSDDGPMPFYPLCGIFQLDLGSHTHFNVVHSDYTLAAYHIERTFIYSQREAERNKKRERERERDNCGKTKREK